MREQYVGDGGQLLSLPSSWRYSIAWFFVVLGLCGWVVAQPVRGLIYGRAARRKAEWKRLEKVPGSA